MLSEHRCDSRGCYICSVDLPGRCPPLIKYAPKLIPATDSWNRDSIQERVETFCPIARMANSPVCTQMRILGTCNGRESSPADRQYLFSRSDYC